MKHARTAYRPAHLLLLPLFLLVALGLTVASPGHTRDRLQTSPPAFSKAFAPATIGPGSSSTLTFTIDNTTDTPAGDLAFSDTLPAGMVIATPSSAETTCSEAVLQAPDGGTTITFSGGRLGANSACTISVNVTSSTIGTYTNTSSDLTSTAGNSGSATAELTVDPTLSGFSKRFAPATVYPDETSTLTFTLDNTANASSFTGSFSDTLPEGVIVATPANLTTDCFFANITASSGATTISATILVESGNACTVAVDVIATTVGEKNNVSSGFSFSGTNAGFATALLTVEPPPAFYKRFLDNPAPPGGVATLEFSIMNMDRRSSATGLTFTDDLDDALSGLEATGLPAMGVCGPGSQISGVSQLILTGGELGPGETCAFTVSLQVPASAAPGIYTNTTSDLVSDAGVIEPPASDELEVEPIPTLLTSFTPDPVGSGSTVDMEFTLTNNSTTNDATDINFVQAIGDVLPGAAVVSLPASGFCGPASTISAGTPPSGVLTLSVSGGSLTPDGDPGDSCTFTVTLALSTSTPDGTYTLTSGAPQATVGGETLTGRAASTELAVVAPPRLTKSFIDDPVAAGDSVTLEFTLTQPGEGSTTATDITFSDSLDGALGGLAAVGLPADDICGTGSRLEGATALNFSGGSLAPTASCSFTVTLQTPVGADPGLYTNSTSNVLATVDGVVAEGPPASDALEIASISLAKSFDRETVVQGDVVTLTFTLTNETPAASVTDIAFTDDLNAALAGLAAEGLPAADVCGAGSQLTGTSTLSFTGGSLAPASSCTFSVTLRAPADATSGEYHNVTSQVTANVDGQFLTVDPASDELIVLNALAFTKFFAAGSARAGQSITLTFTITNESSSNAIADIGFTDDLEAALNGLQAQGLPAADVCGAGSILSGASLLTLEGGALGPGETCVFDVTLQIPADPLPGSVAFNTTDPITGALGGETVTGATATDDLTILLFAFTKSFDGPTAAGGNPTLTFTLENLAQGELSGLSFIDDLGAALADLTAVDLPTAGVCGPGSQLSGTSLLTFTGGSLAAGQSCAFSVTLKVPAAAAPGTYFNTTSDLLSSGLVVGSPATDNLHIEPPPTFDKTFAPNPMPLGATGTLTFTIDNGDSAIAAVDLAFADNLPAGLTIAAPGSTSTTCTGGALSAPDGGATISYSGGTVPAGATCTVAVDVTTDTEGTYANSSGSLTSSLGDSGAASDTLVVTSSPFLVSLTTFPTSVPEPGDAVSVTVVVTNVTSAGSLRLTDLVDETHGDVDGQGSCDLPALIDAGASYACSFSVTVNGSAGDATTHTVTATVVDADGNRIERQDSATITIADVLPSIAAHVTADPTTIYASGDPVTFTLRVTNTGTAEAVTLSELRDDAVGDLNGLGDCSLPAAIFPGNIYQCRYAAPMTGTVGDTVRNTVRAVAEDDEGNTTSAQASAEVDVHIIFYFPFIWIE